MDDLGTDDLARLLGLEKGPAKGGLARQSSSEEEHPDALLAIFPDGKIHRVAGDFANLSPMDLQTLPVRPNTLSPEHIPWPQIDLVSEAAKKPPTRDVYAGFSTSSDKATPKFCRILRKRRSAQAMDGQTSMPLDSFHAILEAALPGSAPFGILPWRPYVHPVIFVHRVEGLESGLYILLRDAAEKEKLRRSNASRFRLGEALAHARPSGALSAGAGRRPVGGQRGFLPPEYSVGWMLCCRYDCRIRGSCCRNMGPGFIRDSIGNAV